jgi:hypothetical protein
MRKIIYITVSILLLVACGSTKDRYVNGVKIPKMIPFKEFNSDTTAYVRSNFENRKSYYIGKTMGVLLDDFELPILHTRLSTGIEKYNGKSVDITGTFFFHDIQKVYNANLKDPNKDTDNDVTGLNVYFEAPYLDHDTILPLIWKYHTAWNEETIPIIRKAIIKDVKFLNYEEVYNRKFGHERTINQERKIE